jgi:glutaminyl-peptide cyclotransferase
MLVTQRFLLFWLWTVLLWSQVQAQDAYLVFPQFVDGLDNRSRVILQNFGSGDLSGSMTFLIETDGKGVLKSGVIEIRVETGESSDLKSNLIFDLMGHSISVIGRSPARMHRIYVSVSPAERTGIAIYNNSSREDALLDLILVDSAGNPSASRELRLGPQEQLSRFIDEDDLFGGFFRRNPSAFRGTLGVYAVSQDQVSVIGLLQDRADGALFAGPIASDTVKGTAISDAVEHLSVRVLAEYPHDTAAFTQGLLWEDGAVYESTGLYGQSSLRQVDLDSGAILRQVRLPGDLFGEGLAKHGDRLIQVTWRENVAIVYAFDSFQKLEEIAYAGEGWGLTYDGTWLVMSNGSDELTFRDPRTLNIWQKIPVRLEGESVALLNELEYAKGQIYANIWQQNKIVRIDPRSGSVTAEIDTSALPYTPVNPSIDILNGIAYISNSDTFLLTGKRWPKIFEVRFEPAIN